jgi:hypothetical protein
VTRNDHPVLYKSSPAAAYLFATSEVPDIQMLQDNAGAIPGKKGEWICTSMSI